MPNKRLCFLQQNVSVTKCGDILAMKCGNVTVCGDIFAMKCGNVTKFWPPQLR